MEERRWTVLELIQSSASYLTRNGIEAARLDSDLMLAHVLGWTRLELYTRHDMPIEDTPRGAFRELVRRRSRGEPLAYILGQREFLEWTFHVDRSVLIPRPDTEAVVRAANGWLSTMTDEPMVLDIGVGSGCILHSILMSHAGARGIGVDISIPAARTAKLNRDRLGISDRASLVVADGLTFLESTTTRFDLIVSNPPYIRRDEAPSLARDIRDFEPETALYSPDDGLWFHRRILDHAAKRLSERGALVFELPGEGGDELAERWKHHYGSGRSQTCFDHGGKERVFIACGEMQDEKKWRDVSA